jgi:SAM-dependent methyltransferase
MPHLDVLQCPACGQPLSSEVPAGCDHCGARFEVLGGDIVSFLPPGAGSTLDDIDYDAVYMVDSGASDHLYRQCRKYLGELLPVGASSYLEIGAGTGLFTLAYLSDARPAHALITDVSAKMLDNCRKRLQTRNVDAHTDVSYALWDGTTRCFRERSFDVIAGFSVLHHVLDYQGLLAILSDTLTDDGRAVFLEPSYGFHRAMIGFMTEVLQSMPVGDPAWTAGDRRRLSWWIGENCINAKFRGDHLALEMREDKHMFDGDSLRRAASDAGYGGCRVIPFGDENEAWTTIKVYMNQMGFSQATRDLLLARCARMMPGQFAYLSAEDRAPSFLIVLERNRSDAQAGVVANGIRADRDVVFTHQAPVFRYAIEFSLVPGTEAGQTTVTGAGWILGDVDVRNIELDGGVRFPVGAIRDDVEAVMNPDSSFPFQRALCCGLLEVRPQLIEATTPGDVGVYVVTTAGDRYALGRLDRGNAHIVLENLAGASLERVPN